MTRRTKQIEAAKNKNALEDLKAILDDSDAELTDLESLEAEPDEEVPSEAEAASDDDEYVGAGYKPSKLEDSEDAEGSGKRRRKSKKQLKWSLPIPFEALGDELLILIFSFIEPKHKTTQRFSRVSKRFRVISQTSYARSQWLLRHYHKSQVLYYAIFMVFSTLLRSTVWSNLAEPTSADTLHKWRYSSTQPYWLPAKWGKANSIPFGSWLAVLNKSYALWGEQMSAAKDKDDSEILRAWIKSDGQSTNIGQGRSSIGFTLVDGALVQGKPTEAGQTSLDAEFAKIKALFETYRFAPFSPEDPFDHYWLDAMCLKPDILPLLLQADVNITDRVSEAVVRPILQQQDLDEDSKVDEVRRLRDMHNDLVPGQSFFASMLRVGTITPDSINLCRRIHQEGLVNFEMSAAFGEALEQHASAHQDDGGANKKDFYRSAGYILLGWQELGFQAGEDRQRLEEAAFLIICFLSKSDDHAASYLSRSGGAAGQFSDQEAATISAAQAMTLQDAIATLGDLQITLGYQHLLRAFQNPALNAKQVMKFTGAVEECTLAAKHAAAKCLFQPHQGLVLKRLMRDVPGVKPFVKQMLVDVFTINCSSLFALRMHGFHSALSVDNTTPRATYSNCFSSRAFYVSWPDNFVWPKGVCWDNRIPNTRAGSTAVWSTLLKAFGDSATIVQMLLLHGSLGKNINLVRACLARNPALSYEYFECLAKFRVEPHQDCYRLIKAGAYQEKMNKYYKPSKTPIEDLTKWHACLQQLVSLYPGSSALPGFSFKSVVKPWIARLSTEMQELKRANAAKAAVKPEPN